MTIPKEILPFFDRFLVDYCGATNVTSDRERELSRGRYEMFGYVVLVLSYPNSSNVVIRTAPEEHQQEIEESWKSYFVAISKGMKENDL